MTLAIELGGDRVRLAGPDAGTGRPRLLARLPSSVPAATAVRTVLGPSAGAVRDIVLTHPPHWSASAIARATADCALAGSVRGTCSSAVAAVREVTARTDLPPGPLAVLEVGAQGGCATVLAGSAGDTVLACRHLVGDVGPTLRPDRAVALLVAAVTDAGLTVPALTGGVLLVGPLAATPALAELVTDLAGEPPLVPDDPDTVAVLGALRPCHVPRRRPTRPRAGPVLGPPGAVPLDDGWLGAGLLPRAMPRRRARPVLIGIAVPLVAGLLALVVTSRVEGGVRRTAVPVAEERTLLAQYDYLLRVPGGWRHSGGLPERRRTLLTPAAAPAGSDLISVEQTPLGYDSAAERDRAFRELRERYQQARDGGSDLDELTLATRVAGRDVIAYRQRQPLRGAEVDWYVLFDRDAQLSVGCQHTPSGIDAVRAACAGVIGSLRLR